MEDSEEPFGAAVYWIHVACSTPKFRCCGLTPLGRTERGLLSKNVWIVGTSRCSNCDRAVGCSHMDNLSGYANRPLPFMLRYLRQRLASHVVILASVVAAVACSVGTQYGVKYLVDGLSAGPARAGGVWLAFVLLMSLITADNFLWRIASWTASFTFVGVTGDLRRDIFRHLTGHAPSYFSDRLPGMLTSRITATSNAVFTVENMFVWNVLPPCIATVAALALIGTVSPLMAGGLIVVAGAMVFAMFHLAAAGKPLHDDFANKAAAVDGEMVDVINNMPLVRAFCGLSITVASLGNV
jgi:ATP-binding cassette, subfamily B, bacterial